MLNHFDFYNELNVMKVLLRLMITSWKERQKKQISNEDLCLDKLVILQDHRQEQTTIVPCRRSVHAHQKQYK